MLFSVVSGLSFSIYSFKMFLFLVTGSPSTNKTLILPQSLLCTPTEIAVGVSLTVAGSLVMLCYTFFVNRKKKQQQNNFMFRIDPVNLDDGKNPFDRNTDGEGEITL